MIRLTLKRLKTGDQGTFGQVSLSIDPWSPRTFQTGELPWRDNHASESCILPDVYLCHMAFSPHFKRDVYHLEDKHGRSSVLIHPANFMGDKSKGLKCELEGCIALGLMTGFRDGQLAILNSREAVDLFNRMLGNQDFELSVEAIS